MKIQIILSYTQTVILSFFPKLPTRLSHYTIICCQCHLVGVIIDGRTALSDRDFPSLSHLSISLSSSLFSFPFSTSPLPLLSAPSPVHGRLLLTIPFGRQPPSLSLSLSPPYFFHFRSLSTSPPLPLPTTHCCCCGLSRAATGRH